MIAAYHGYNLTCFLYIKKRNTIFDKWKKAKVKKILRLEGQSLYEITLKVTIWQMLRISNTPPGASTTNWLQTCLTGLQFNQKKGASGFNTKKFY